MKNAKIQITDVENGWVVTITLVVGEPAEGEIGLLGFMRGYAQQGAVRNLVCKSWGEVLATLAAAEEGVSKAQALQGGGRTSMKPQVDYVEIRSTDNGWVLRSCVLGAGAKLVFNSWAELIAHLAALEKAVA